MTNSVLLAIGTHKGLWIGRSRDDRSWAYAGPNHPMTGVHSVAIDTRGPVPRVMAGVVDEHFGDRGRQRRSRRDLPRQPRR